MSKKLKIVLLIMIVVVVCAGYGVPATQFTVIEEAYK